MLVSALHFENFRDGLEIAAAWLGYDVKYFQILIIVVLYSSMTERVHARSTSGNSLYEACSEIGDFGQQGFCSGFILGEIEGQFFGAALVEQALGGNMTTDEFNAFANSVFHHCIPEEASIGQLIDVVKLYLKLNPAKRH